MGRLAVQVLQRLRSVGRRGHLIPHALQCLAERRPHIGIVLDDQDDPGGLTLFDSDLSRGASQVWESNRARNVNGGGHRARAFGVPRSGSL